MTPPAPPAPPRRVVTGALVAYLVLLVALDVVILLLGLALGDRTGLLAVVYLWSPVVGLIAWLLAGVALLGRRLGLATVAVVVALARLVLLLVALALTAAGVWAGVSGGNLVSAALQGLLVAGGGLFVVVGVRRHLVALGAARPAPVSAAGGEALGEGRDGGLDVRR